MNLIFVMKIYSVCTATARDAFLRIQQVIIYHLFFSLFMFTLLPMWNFLEFPRVTLDIWIVTLFNSIKNSHEIMALRSEKFKFIARGIFFLKLNSCHTCIDHNFYDVGLLACSKFWAHAETKDRYALNNYSLYKDKSL